MTSETASSMSALADPSLTVAIAAAAGAVSQAIARHIRLPGIVLLLGFGVLLGPDGLGLIWPESMGDALGAIVGFAVAVILFEGGMSLNLKRLRSAQKPVRRLVTIGALVTAVGGTLIARATLGWEWRTCVLFGTLIIVTGPTVINPLLRRIKVERRVATVLEAEGILGDAVGAITAAVALEVALSPSGATVALGPLDLLWRLGFGALFGGAVGFLLGWLLRFRTVVPEGLENTLVLSFVFLLFHVANFALHETGIPAVAAAGFVIGNLRGVRGQRELIEFKEQLTSLFIGLLFILLAADVRLEAIGALGAPALMTVALLVFVLRPLTVFSSTWGTALSLRERLFMSWIGPRGIVAAAVASLFASRLAAQDYEGGQELQAMVFLVIAASVVLAGVTGGFVARLLNLKRKQAGWVILGANPLAREVALLMREAGQDTVNIDTNADYCHDAEEAGLRVLHGSGLQPSVLLRAGIAHRRGVLAVTANDEVNYLFARRARDMGEPEVAAATLSDVEHDTTEDMLDHIGAYILFGQTRDVPAWSVRVRKQLVQRERWRLGRKPTEDEVRDWSLPYGAGLWVLAERDGNVAPVTTDTRFRRDDIATLLVATDKADEIANLMERNGWSREAAVAARPDTKGGDALAAG